MCALKEDKYVRNGAIRHETVEENSDDSSNIIVYLLN